MSDALENMLGLKGVKFNLDSLQPEQQQMLVFIAAAFADVELKLSAMQKELHELAKGRKEVGDRVDNIPTPLLQENASEYFAGIVYKLELMWSLGKWAISGLAAGTAAMVWSEVSKVI